MYPVLGKITILIVGFAFTYLSSFAQIHIDTIGVNSLVKDFMLGESVYVSNIKFSGSPLAIALFNDSSKITGLKQGIMLSTGNVFFSYGPNKSEYTSWINQLYGDEDLQNIAHGKTYDAAILEFDFIPASENIQFEYIFASEEYKEYVGSKFNDVFGFWIQKEGDKSKINVGTIGDRRIPVTVNTINFETNKELFVDNSYTNTTDPILWDTRKRKVIPNKNYGKTPVPAPYYVQFDGFTTILTASLSVVPGEKYHIKMGISDVSDAIYDSWVIIKSHSFSSTGIKKVELDKFKLPELTYIEKIKWGQESIDIKPIVFKIPKVKPWKFISQNEVNFEFDKYQLGENSKNYIEKILVEIDTTTEYLIYLQGHTDNKGSDNYNLRLSAKRVNQIYLEMLKSGIPPSQIITNHFGEFIPIDTNETEKGRARNRRVEIIIYYRI